MSNTTTPNPQDAGQSESTVEVSEAIEANYVGADDERRIRIRIKTPAQILNLVPYLLGFHTDKSVVVIGTKEGLVQVTQRVDLYQPNKPNLTHFAAQGLVSVLAREECAKAFVVGYGPEDCVTPFVGQFRDLATENDIAVPEILRAEDGRYWSYVCTDSACCPPEGTPYELTADPELARLLADGNQTPLGSREDLVAQVGSVRGSEAGAMSRATSRANARYVRLREQTWTAADEPSKRAGRTPLIAEGITAGQIAIQRYREGGAISRTEAGWLTVILREVEVRDDFWSRLLPEDRKTNLPLLLDLTRLARGGYVAAPASLLAFVAWQCGNGALANVALDRALADRPEYTLAQTLLRAINLGANPQLAKASMTPEQVAEAYAKRAAGEATNENDEEDPLLRV